MPGRKCLRKTLDNHRDYGTILTVKETRTLREKIMGLDMYMKASRYVSGYNHSSDDEKALFKKITKVANMTALVSSDAPSVTVRTNVAYWRKANSIHNWFVKNLANGVDECQEIYVSVGDMQQLVDECKSALKLYRAGQVSEAGKKMPPAEGFFFGDTAVDDYWAEDLILTIEQLEPLIAVGDDELNFYYRASW